MARRRISAATALATLAAALTSAAAATEPPAPPAEQRPRVIVLTDIGNEPDDSESLVRFLLYSNEFDVAGLVATTSTWQRDRVQPQLILERIDAYQNVRPNLVRHASGYPTAAALRSVVRSGRASYGMQGVGSGQDTAASQLIVQAVDSSDARPVWVLAWGGAADLAQALWSVRNSRTPEQLQRFVAKLRIYSISDQDDAGPWIRRSFPQLFWIASVHGWGQYNMATWSGISGDRRSTEKWPDAEMVSDAWLQDNVRRGPLGQLYPLPKFIMEGDTPSFLYLVPNGLGEPEHPEYGSWGGRYMRAAPDIGHHADVKDSLVRDGKLWSGNQASVYRWRKAFQNDFAARIAWSLTPSRASANHPPALVLQGQAGTGPVGVQVRPGQTVQMDASGSRDPDGDRLAFSWWQYREVGGLSGQPAIEIANAAQPRASFVVPVVTSPTSLHLILEARDSGVPSLTRYRRLIVHANPE